MSITKSQVNFFIFVKLPSAFICGVRAKYIDALKCEATVKYRYMNQNPFNSMYFAVQAMAAELTTGALVLSQIKDSKKNISMLVANSKSNFSKKAVGRITFTCNDGLLIANAVKAAVVTNEGQTIWMKSIGINENGEQVSEFDFEWSIRVKI